MREVIYKNNKVVLDEGIFFSKGVFETILYLEKPIFFREHIERLKEGMKKIALEDLEEEMLIEFLSLQSIKNKAVKLLVTPKNILITEREIPYNEKDYREGSSLTLSKVIRNSTSILSYIKSTSYIENIIEKEKANRKGFKDVLFLNENGYIAETSCANIFIIKNKEIYTPKLSCGLLNGIIRNWVIENFQVKEENLTVDFLENSEGIFITNSLMGIMEVRKFQNREYIKSDIIKFMQEEYKRIILI